MNLNTLNKRLLSLLAAAMLSFALQAEEDETEFVDAPEPPDLPDPIESGEAIEPEVTIIQRDDGVIEEYRLNGRFYMAKVTPKAGPSYYLIDNDGDGQFETRMGNIYNTEVVPHWVLFRW